MKASHRVIFGKKKNIVDALRDAIFRVLGEKVDGSGKECEVDMKCSSFVHQSLCANIFHGAATAHLRFSTEGLSLHSLNSVTFPLLAKVNIEVDGTMPSNEFALKLHDN